MVYGQKNYNEIQGIDGKYRINQIGCFLTAFCNLMDRFGAGIDPLSLNAQFRDRGFYIDIDDRIRDDLNWGTISQVFGDVVVTRSVVKGVADRTAGWPESPQAIVRFYYRSVQTGLMTTHFALVVDPENKTIIDSWDGVLKRNPYGGPTGWAEYTKVPPPAPVVPVVAPPPAPAPGVNHYEAVDKDFVTNQDPTHVWDLDAMDWPGFKPVTNVPIGTPWHAAGVYHHPIGADYYMDKDSFGDAANNGIPAKNQGINHADLDVPAIVAPPVGETVSVTVTTTPPNDTPVNEVPTVTATEPPEDPDAWKLTLDTSVKGRRERALESILVTDLSGEMSEKVPLTKGLYVPIGAVVQKDKQFYYLSQRSVNNGYWFGVPVDILGGYTPEPKDDEDIDEDLDLSIVEELRDFAQQATKREFVVHVVGMVQEAILYVVTFRFLRKNKNKT